MQCVILVTCTRGPSLRDSIAKDPKIGKYGLLVTEQKRPGRPHGWAKVHSTEEVPGAINIEWHPSARMLSCRIVTRKPNTPHEITGVLVRYLLARHHRRIDAISIHSE